MIGTLGAVPIPFEERVMTTEATQPKIVSMNDVPADTRRGSELRTVLSPRTVGSTSGFMGVATLPPGDKIAEHYHPYSEEFVFVVKGPVIARLDGVRHEVPTGSGLYIPINVRHRFMNEGTEEAFIVFHLGPLAPRPELGHVDTEES
jgi:quercetin dioxygenase-like cupin family protein